MMNSIRALRKAAIFLIGALVVLVGVILIPAPGPGLLVIIGGLLILSIEFDWAKRYLHQARQSLEAVRQKVKPKNTSAKDVDRPGDHKGKRKSGN